MRKTESAYHELASKRGWKWLGPLVTSIRIQTNWQCPNEHQLRADFEHFRRGVRCKVCSNLLPKTEFDFNQLASSIGAEWLGPIVSKRNELTKWSCELKHVWEGSYNAILYGSNCPICESSKNIEPEILQKLAQEQGLRWLGFSRPDQSASSWECQNLHNWEAAPFKLREKPGCPTCRKVLSIAKISFGPEKYDELAKENEFVWLGPKVRNTYSKTSWQCNQNHKFPSTYSSLKAGNGCPKCSAILLAKRRALKDSAFIDAGFKNGFKWIGPLVKDSKTRTTWECSKQHRWEAVLHEIKRGSGCPICARANQGTQKRFGNDKYHNLAKEADLIWLGPAVAKTSMKTLWQCKEGHQWEAQYNNILHGNGCPKCSSISRAKERRFDSSKYVELALKNSLTWIGPDVPLTKTKTWWRCINSHEWLATYQVIREGRGCTQCNKIRRTELSHTEITLKKRRRNRDSSKKSLNAIRLPLEKGGKRLPADYHLLAQQRKFKWLGPEVSNTHTKTEWECASGHRWEAIFTKILQGRGCPICARTTQSERQRLKPEDYEEMARIRKITWLGPIVENNNKKCWWQCADGHKWQTTYHSLNSGQGCSVCGKKSTADKLRLKPESYFKLAEERNLKWVGPIVSNAVSKTGWECSEGHQWLAQYNNIQSGSGCPHCSRKKRGNTTRNVASEYEALARKQSVKWLGTEVKSVKSKTLWECQFGHKWQAPFSTIKAGHSCPKCAIQNTASSGRTKSAEYIRLGETRGFCWLGPRVANTGEKTEWKCSREHRWFATYSHIASGRGCPKCGKQSAASKTRLQDEVYQNLAKSMTLKWIGPPAANRNTLTEWECVNGHTWLATLKNLEKSAGCPQCSNYQNGVKVSSQQRKIAAMIGGEVNYPAGNYKVDVAVFIAKQKIAIEYDAWYWHSKKQAHDAIRDNFLEGAGWKILRVKSNQLVPSAMQLNKGIAKLIAGCQKIEIILDDWGVGRAWNAKEDAE